MKDMSQISSKGKITRTRGFPRGKDSDLENEEGCGIDRIGLRDWEIIHGCVSLEFLTSCDVFTG